MATWHIIGPEYPPARGGVADYTQLVATELAARGDRVHVWAPATPGAEEPGVAGVDVHRLPGRFGPRALALLGRGLNAYGRSNILVQYVPQGFGMRAMNLPFCLWLLMRRGAAITIMFHEAAVAIEWRRQPMRHNVIGMVNRAMVFVLTHAARQCLISAAEWEKILRPLAPTGSSIRWLPVPSNVPVVEDRQAAYGIRKCMMAENDILLGHFGSGREPWIQESLAAIVPQLLRKRPGARFLLMGRDSLSQRDRLLTGAPELNGRIHCSGPLAPADLSRHLSACDLMLQPYNDGVSTRRGSVMAALAHRRPVVTTDGVLTEPLWRQSGAVALSTPNDTAGLCAAAARLMDDAQERARLGTAAGALYADRFDITHTIAVLREAGAA